MPVVLSSVSHSGYSEKRRCEEPNGQRYLVRCNQTINEWVGGERGMLGKRGSFRAEKGHLFIRNSGSVATPRSISAAKTRERKRVLKCYTHTHTHTLVHTSCQWWCWSGVGCVGEQGSVVCGDTRALHLVHSTHTKNTETNAHTEGRKTLAGNDSTAG